MSIVGANMDFGQAGLNSAFTASKNLNIHKVVFLCIHAWIRHGIGLQRRNCNALYVCSVARDLR